MWFRVNDPYLYKENGVNKIHGCAMYYPKSPCKSIRTLYMGQAKDTNLPLLYVGVDCFHHDLWMKLLRDYDAEKYAKKQLENSYLTIEFRPNNDIELNQLIKIFLAINKYESFELMTSTFLEEIKNFALYVLPNAVFSPDFQYRQYPVETYRQMVIDSNDKPGELARLVHSYADLFKKVEESNEAENNIFESRKKTFISLVKKQLSKGENPNQFCYSTRGMSELIFDMISVGKNSRILSKVALVIPELVEVMMKYKANPYLRGGYGFLSAREEVLCSGSMEVLNLMDSFLNKPEKSLNLVKVQHQSSHALGSAFELENGEKIYTYCKKTANMAKWEWIELLKLYKQYFKMEDSSKLETELLKEIIDDDKYIDFIFAGQRLIGFNINQVVTLKNYPDTITIYALYTLMHADYLYTKLAPLLHYRFFHAVQCLYPDKKVMLFALIASNEAYGMFARNGVHFPKYIHRGAKRMVKRILERIEPAMLADYTHENITNFVLESVGLTKPMDPTTFFYKHILGYGNSKNTDMRSAPCYFYIGGQSLSALNGLAIRLGISLSSAIVDIARILKKMQKPTSLTHFTFANSHLLFWEGKREEDRESTGVAMVARACELFLNEPKPKL
jgi:hypothetical protein